MNLSTPTLATAASSLLRLAGLQIVARKPRSDAILRRLPPEQRAKVDRWLFDKNLTYAQVAEGCQKMFGLKISKSSVGRYFERRSLEALGSTRVSSILRSIPATEDGPVLSGVSPESVALPSASPSTNTQSSHLESIYRLLLRRLTELAFREVNQSPDGLEPKWLCRLMRLIIASRHEDNFAARVRLERDMFEIGAAKACLKHWQTARGSASRSQPRMSQSPRISCTSEVATLLRVTDPRSFAIRDCPLSTQPRQPKGQTPLLQEMEERLGEEAPYCAGPYCTLAKGITLSPSPLPLLRRRRGGNSSSPPGFRSQGSGCHPPPFRAIIRQVPDDHCDHKPA